jgi:hypothetical protein
MHRTAPPHGRPRAPARSTDQTPLGARRIRADRDRVARSANPVPTSSWSQIQSGLAIRMDRRTG